MRVSCTAIFVVTLVGLLAPVPTAAQAISPFRVRLHVSADDGRKTAALAGLASALRPIRDIEVTDRDADYVLSLVILPVSTGGFVVSVLVMNVHTEATVDARARAWGMREADRQQMIALFKGSGALLDQRVVTGPDLVTLCGDIALAFSADTLEPQRRLRAPAR